MRLHTTITILILCIPFVLATFWAVFDAANREFGGTGKKAAWMMVAAVPFIGFVVYLLLGRWRGRKPEIAS